MTDDGKWTHFTLPRVSPEPLIVVLLAGLGTVVLSVLFDTPRVWPGAIVSMLIALTGYRFMTRSRRTAEARRARILTALEGGVAMSGLELSRTAGVSAGRVYVDLAWLEGNGWVKSGWEIPPPVNRPARRMYFR